MAKDLYFTVIVLITLVIDLTSGLWLSQEYAIKNVGDTFVVVCKDKSRGHPVTWKGPNNSPIGQRSHLKYRTSSFGTVLTFNNAREEDSGNYTCSTTIQPYEKNVFFLTVVAPIVFEDTPKVQYIKERQNGTLRCEVNLKDATIEWLFEGNAPVVDPNNLVNGAPKYQAIADGLLIRNASREDSKEYICEARHTSSGTVKRQAITLIVQHKPYAVYAQESVIYGFANEDKNLTCEVEAEPKPRFRWTEVQEGKKGKGVPVTEEVIEESTHKSVLQINLTEDHNTTYKCTVTNNLGENDIYFDVQVVPKPEPPLNLSLTEATSDSIQLKITLPEVTEELKKAGAVPNFLVVEYRNQSSAEEDWLSQEFNITDVPSVQVLLKELTKNTTYQVQVATKNIGGLSDYSTIFATTSKAPRSVQAIMPIFSVLLVSLSIILSSEMRKA